MPQPLQIDLLIVQKLRQFVDPIRKKANIYSERSTPCSKPRFSRRLNSGGDFLPVYLRTTAIRAGGVWRAPFDGLDGIPPPIGTNSV
ncbi:unnamed protein product [Caenorhabditis auriculariae]|uniref:Uncharacterized protein n=1 Tax=Caenorhabditis auriculariae TaxID=2777116 RepID=A0A8S1HGF9_9PELO|nr:unnamed protein product [Caenorhabditis auriculariae]